jgi:ACS family pantothenate transporter-like MFS transporter
MSSEKTAQVQTVSVDPDLNEPAIRDFKGSSSDSGNETSDAADVVKATPDTTWRSYVWDTLDKSKAERRFLFKLDAVLLSLASFAFFIKYLDQVNINNAFVSGMREDLQLFGNELNYMQTAWTIGYIIGEIPRCVGRSRPKVPFPWSGARG